MGTISEILAERETRQRETLRQQWADYRSLLERSNAGTLTADDGDELAGLMAALQLSPAEAQAHCDSLRGHAAMLARQAKIAPLKTQLAELDPQIEALSVRRAEMLAKVDSDLRPLLHRSTTLNHELQSHETFLDHNGDRETRRHPKLFGIGFDPPPSPRPQPTAAQRDESSRREELWDFFVRVRKDLLQGLPRNKGWGHDIQTAVTMVFRYGLEPNSDPLLFVPPGGWPRVEDGYHTDIAKDPRRKEILRIARAARQPNTEIGDHGKYLLGVGRTIGLLDALNMPIAQTDTADEEADATE